MPHGLEGQGPEHSSAKIERYLELCDDDFSYLPTAEPGETIDQIMTRQLFEINWIICNLTTPANFFHVLRRQIHMPFRKPLVSYILLYLLSLFLLLKVNPGITVYLFNQCIMTPKSLLRHPMALSPFADMESGTSFKPILSDPFVKPGNIQKVLMCSGRVFYDLVTERQGKQLVDKIAIIRIEQLCPFPYHLLAEEMKKYPNAKVN